MGSNNRSANPNLQTGMKFCAHQARTGEFKIRTLKAKAPITLTRWTDCTKKQHHTYGINIYLSSNHTHTTSAPKQLIPAYDAHMHLYNRLKGPKMSRAKPMAQDQAALKPLPRLTLLKSKIHQCMLNKIKWC